MLKKSGIFIVVLLLCFSVYAVSAQDILVPQESAGSGDVSLYTSADGIGYSESVKSSGQPPGPPPWPEPTPVPEFPTMVLPLGMVVSLFAVALVLRR